MDYQQIYTDEDWYGNAHQGRCPGNRLYPQYKDWLVGKILDIGCGRGHTVELLRREGFICDGIDQININQNMMVGDITKPLCIDGEDYTTCLCIDVIEHIPDDILDGLFDNFKLFDKQIFSIHNGPSVYKGEELHVNRKPFDEWRSKLSQHFNITHEITIHEEQMLYHSNTKS